MHVPIPLGGFNAKAAEAYLLPPKEEDEKKKKKRKRQKQKRLSVKEALLVDAIAEKRAEMLQKLRDHDLGGGWNPLNQPISE